MDGTSSSPSVPLIPLVTSCCSERKPKLCTSPLPYGPPLSECDSAALSPFCFARLRSHRVHPSKPPHSPQSSTPALALVARRYLIRCEFLLMKLIQPSALGRLTHSSNDLFYLTPLNFQRFCSVLPGWQLRTKCGSGHLNDG